MTGTPEKTPAQPPSVAKTPYGIVMEALEEILELDVDEGSFDDARAIASLAHSRAIAHWSRPAEPKPLRELAAAVAETRKMRDVVCKLLDLFGAPDDRLMQQARVTRATLQRYAAEAGVRLDGLDKR
jgi:hypothetical protein